MGCLFLLWGLSILHTPCGIHPTPTLGVGGGGYAQPQLWWVVPWPSTGPELKPAFLTYKLTIYSLVMGTKVATNILNPLPIIRISSGAQLSCILQKKMPHENGVRTLDDTCSERRSDLGRRAL